MLACSETTRNQQAEKKVHEAMWEIPRMQCSRTYKDAGSLSSLFIFIDFVCI